MVEQLDPPAQNAAGDPSHEGSDGAESWSPPPATSGEQRFRDWIAQLQTMIDGVTTAAAPHVREIAAKAAELAAKAGDAAGPVAKKAAGVTSDVGQKVAAKSRDFAADMRRMTESDAPTNGNGAEPAIEPATESKAQPNPQTPFSEPPTEA
jgi:hypothetical protein